MCGIHGVVNFSGQPVVPEILAAMGQITQHRGPDDAGMYIDGDCGIAMRRLSIIDLAGGHQPLTNSTQTLWLVCNGEIYNYRELRAELQAKGYQFKTHSDSEVLLHLYAAEGDAFVQRLNGMFDFALWDAPRRRLLIGRDRLGVKPLYVLQDDQRLGFASEAKALLQLPGIRAALDTNVVAGYLHLGYVAAPGCIFKGMRKLPPATLLSVERGQVREWQYWQIPHRINQSLTQQEWAARVRAQLDASVHMQMVSDVPIGAFLSGGIDSSAIVGLMAQHTTQPIRTYAIGFAGGTAETLYNELPFARRVAELFGTQHREIVVKPDVVSLLPKLLWHMDEPIADTAFITTFLVAEFARQDVKVILSGVGGDELFGGYRRYLGAHYAQRLQSLPRWLRASLLMLVKRLPVGRHSGVLNKLRLAKGFLNAAAFNADDRYRSYVQVLERTAVAALMLQPDLTSDPLTLAFAQAQTDDELNHLLRVDAQTQLPDDLLLLTDKMSMAVSLECRVPLLDHVLVELAASMPAAIKIRDGQLKCVMKAALADLLPQDILQRKKRGFGMPIGAWLKRELAPLLRHLLSAEQVESRGLLRQSVLEQLIRDHQANRFDGTDVLSALMNLEIWSRVFLDQRDPAEVADELRRYV